MDRKMQDMIAKSMDFTRPFGPQIDMLADKHELEREEVVEALRVNKIYNPAIDNDKPPDAGYTGRARPFCGESSPEKKSGQRAPRRDWSEDDVNLLMRLIKSGATLKEMGERLGRSPGSVSGKKFEIESKGFASPAGAADGAVERKETPKKERKAITPSPQRAKEPVENETPKKNMLPIFGDVAAALAGASVISETHDYENDIQYYLLRTAGGNFNITIEGI